MLRYEMKWDEMSLEWIRFWLIWQIYCMVFETVYSQLSDAFSRESRSFTKPWAPWRSRFWGRWQLADFAVFWRFSWKVNHLSEVGKPQAGCLKGDTGVWDDLWFHRYFHILMHWMRLWYSDMQVWHPWYPLENDLQIQLRFSPNSETDCLPWCAVVAVAMSRMTSTKKQSWEN